VPEHGERLGRGRDGDSPVAGELSRRRDAVAGLPLAADDAAAQVGDDPGVRRRGTIRGSTIHGY
jgi:hypothetical protein